MAEDRKPADPAAERPQDEPKPGFDPVHPANDPAVERDPAVPPRTTTTTVVNSGGRGNILIAAIIAIVAIIAAIIAMNWDWGDPQATVMPADPAAVEETAPAVDEPAAAEEATEPVPAEEAEPVE